MPHVEVLPNSAAAVAPVVAGTAFAVHPNRIIEGFLLDGVARMRLGDGAGAERSTERALALAEPQGRAWIFVTVPDAGELLASVATAERAGIATAGLETRRLELKGREEPVDVFVLRTEAEPAGTAP